MAWPPGSSWVTLTADRDVRPGRWICRQAGCPFGPRHRWLFAIQGVGGLMSSAALVGASVAGCGSRSPRFQRDRRTPIFAGDLDTHPPPPWTAGARWPDGPAASVHPGRQASESSARAHPGCDRAGHQHCSLVGPEPRQADYPAPTARARAPHAQP